ncbi:hypothetical protein [Cupriavidus sp. DF5525]|uniref:hypothetical protein n=1 Tax=Cupriavidus sp. DF5525 TaxID=3160989 RepID=UPI0032DE7DBB
MKRRWPARSLGRSNVGFSQANGLSLAKNLSHIIADHWPADESSLTMIKSERSGAVPWHQMQGSWHGKQSPD